MKNIGAILVLCLLPFCALAQPLGRLEEMAAASDLVFKGQALSSERITNSAFGISFYEVYATKFKLISVLKGNVTTNEIVFQHYGGWNGRGGSWGGPPPPPSYKFETGQSYLVFAARMDRPDQYYSVLPGKTNRPDEFRQLFSNPHRSGEGAMRTLDNRPVAGLSVKDAHWRELNLLLNDTNPTNQLYAIDTLDHMSLVGRGDDKWSRSDDFNREVVLSALLPLVTNINEEVANHAINCFENGSDNTASLESFTNILIKVANKGLSPNLRLNAISSLLGTHFEAISNSLTQLLKNPEKNVRASAVELLTRSPSDFSEPMLQQLADDTSALVRAAVANAIGNEKDEHLLPTLAKLFADPVGRQKPVGPLTSEDVEGGGHIAGVGNGTTIVDDPSYPGANVGDVHTGAGYALLKFDVSQVGEILKTNLNDAGFRLQFLCKLAENDPKPWINDMTEMMEARRTRIEKQAETSSVEPRDSYFEALMALSGSYFHCWNIIYNYLAGLPYADFANGKSDCYLNMLEQAGNTGPREPVMLYELYKMKGLNKRAAGLRKELESKFAVYGINLDKIDGKYPSNGVIPDQ